MGLSDFGKMLEQITANVGHFKAKKAGFPRIVFSETERLYYHGDNVPGYKKWKVDVNYFTREHFDPNVEKLENLLEERGIPFDMIAVQYGDTTMDGKTLEKGVIFYLFECEV